MLKTIHVGNSTALAFFDPGANINLVTAEFIKKLGMTDHVVDRGKRGITYGNLETVQESYQTIELQVDIADLAPTKLTFRILKVPMGCDLLIGIQWNRRVNPIIDWENDEIYDRHKFIQRLIDHKAIHTITEQKVFQQRTRILKNKIKQNNRHRHHQRGRHLGPKRHVHQELGTTVVISGKQFKRQLRKKSSRKDLCIVINERMKYDCINEMLEEDTKAERQTKTTWESFKDNPVYPLLLKYKSIFEQTLPKGLPPHGDHEIEVQPGTGAMFRQQWRLSPEQAQTIKEWVKSMLDAGLIQPSISPHAAPIFFVKKPVGWRIVHDYRLLNSKTIRQSTPMPRKESVLDRMANSHWFSTMDLLSGYYQVRVREKDIPYTAFQTPEGLYEYLVLPMGLSNAPATFNRIGRRIFTDMEEIASTYFDDIYVYTKTDNLQEHLEALERVFKRLQEKKLYIKLSKSIFCAPEIPCLGDFVGRQGVRIDPEKVKIIRNWPRPQNKRQLQSFLGLTVYVHRFCQEYSEISDRP